MKKLLPFAGCLSCLIFASVQLPAAERWAIVASEEVRRSGVADLLTAELSAVEGIELVDRDELDKVNAELNLAAFFGDQSVARRIEFGKTLNARRLLVLQAEKTKNPTDPQPLRVTILDTLVGARLYSSGDLQLENEGRETLVKRLVQSVQDINRLYKDGIHAVIGIPFFLSKSLEQKYDYLQRDYQRLLEASLSGTPGVAVISVEETEAIQREINLAGSEIRRVVPLFVIGEYEMNFGREAETAPALRVTVAISDGSKTLETVRRDAVPLNDVPALLAQTVVPAILRRAGDENVTPLSLQEQEKRLIERADRFSEVGALELAEQLRLAVLLLNPNNARQRLLLIADHAAGRDGKNLTFAYPHIEYLLRNKQVNLVQAGELYRILTTWKAKSTVKYLNGRFVNIYPEGTPEYLQDEHRPVFRLFPFLLALPPAKNSAESTLFQREEATGEPVEYTLEQIEEQYQRLVTTLYPVILNECRRRPEHSVEILFDFIDSLPPGHLPISFRGDTYSAKNWSWFPDENVAALREKFRRTGDPVKVFFGDYLALALEIERHPENADRRWYEECLRLDELRMQWASESPPRLTKATDEIYRQRLYGLRVKREQLLEARADALSGKKRRPAIANPIVPFTETETRYPRRFTIAPIPDAQLPDDTPFAAEVEKNRRFGTWSAGRMLRFDDSTDILWTPDRIFTLKAVEGGKPVLKKIFERDYGDVSSTRQLLRVRHDGENIWVATPDEGILVLSLDGECLARIDETNGLPTFVSPELPDFGKKLDLLPDGVYLQHPREMDHFSYRASLHELCTCIYFRPLENGSSGPSRRGKLLRATLSVWPFSPGKALAMGRFGPTERTWIALLTFDRTAGKIDARLLHSATRTLSPETYKDLEFLSAPEQIDVTFDVLWICRYEEPGDPTRQVAILGRAHNGSKKSTILNKPLAIDLQTFEVTTLAERLPQFAELHGGTSVECVHGSLLVSNNRQLEAFRQKDDGTYKHTQLPIKESQSGYLIRRGDTVYSPGEAWFKVDFAAGKAEAIGKQVDPPISHLLNFAVSANYGIWVSEGSARPYRIDFDTSSVVVVKQSEFDFVPAENLDAHLKAVDAIRRLGGSVGSTTHNQRQQSEQVFYSRKGKGTIVCLDENWQGTEEDFKRLNDLYNLTSLYLMDVPIDDRTFRQLENHHNLDELYLLGTNVTTEGLKSLSLPQLRGLYLENKPGEGGFDDETLKLFLGHRRLYLLGLSGDGFTEKSIPTINTFASLVYLRLNRTGIDPGAAAKILSPRQKQGICRIRVDGEDVPRELILKAIAEQKIGGSLPHTIPHAMQPVSPHGETPKIEMPSIEMPGEDATPNELNAFAKEQITLASLATGREAVMAHDWAAVRATDRVLADKTAAEAQIETALARKITALGQLSEKGGVDAAQPLLVEMAEGFKDTRQWKWYRLATRMAFYCRIKPVLVRCDTQEFLKIQLPALQLFETLMAERQIQKCDLQWMWILGAFSEIILGPDKAVIAYKDYIAVLKDSDVPSIRQASEMLEGAVRRVESPGKPFVTDWDAVEGHALDRKALEGKTVLYVFWAFRYDSHPVPCANDYPWLMELYKTYHEKGLEIVWILKQRELEELKQFRQQHDVPWQTVVIDDTRPEPKNPWYYYGVVTLPKQFLVGPDGKVIQANIHNSGITYHVRDLYDAKGNSEPWQPLFSRPRWLEAVMPDWQLEQPFPKEYLKD